MQRVHLNGVDLEYDVQGSGEPLVLIHGSILADAFVPLLANPPHCQSLPCDLVSSPAALRAVAAPVIRSPSRSKPRMAAYCSVTSASPGRVSPATLTGPPLHCSGRAMPRQTCKVWHSWNRPSSRLFPRGQRSGRGSPPSGSSSYDPGDKAGAVDAFLTAVVGAEYRQVIAQFLPPGALELAVADLDTFFQVELPALQQWRFTTEDATRIRQPVLTVVGTETAPIFVKATPWSSSGYRRPRNWSCRRRRMHSSI